MRRKAIVATAAALVVLGVGGAWFAWNRSVSDAAVAARTAPPAAVPVVAGTVQVGDVPIYLSGIGTVQAYNTVTVRSQIQGQITQIAFTEGQTVHAGDLLAQIDPRTYQAQLDQAIAAKKRDEAHLANAQLNLGRYVHLGAYASQQSVDSQRSAVLQQQAAVASDEAAIENAQTLLSYARLTSPIDGVTGIRQIDIGNIIHPTDPNGLVVVTQIEPISVIFTLPETDLPRIQQEMAKGPLTAIAYSQDNKTVLDQGQLLLIDNEINQGAGTIQLKATFPNKAHRLWPGQLVNVHLQLEIRHNGLTVAAGAVQQGPQGAYVYVIASDGTAMSRPVTVSQLGNKRALIDSGLKAGERVIVDGQSRVQFGMRVAVVTGTAAETLANDSALQMDIP